MKARTRAPKNRTVTLTQTERAQYLKRLVKLRAPATPDRILDRTICQDISDIAKFLPPRFVDLLFIDPPYNLTKVFNERPHRRQTIAGYKKWMESWLTQILHTLKPTASVYICSDWQSSAAVHLIAEKYFKIRNRITWEREKGRGALRNWKNCSEDILYCTISDDYCFNVENVKLKRKVIAPYRDGSGKPKGWKKTKHGSFRLTYPSNFWADITVPFWSMPENTDHPTQKPEKLLAKVVVASSNAGDVVFDPFVGSGTTSVVAKKLARRFVGVEIDEMYCCLAEKRLLMAETHKTIQGYHHGVFWERNTGQDRMRRQLEDAADTTKRESEPTFLFDLNA